MTSHTHTTVVLSHRKQQGFTLIEVMIVVAIIGILTAIAIPNYTQYVQNSRRGDAAAVLMANQQFMQRFYTANNRYDNLINGTGGPPTLPFTRSPDSGAIAYNISFLGTPTRTTYTLQAIPTANMNGDRCGTLTINETGARGLVGNGAGTTVAQCWR